MGSEFTPDLTEPVEAAARRHYEELLGAVPDASPNAAWDELDDMWRRYHRQVALDYVVGAAPSIVAQTLRWAADKVDAGPDVPLPPSVYSALLREFAEEVSDDVA